MVLSSLRTFSLNVGMRRDLAGLRALILQYKFDLVLIQELNLTQCELQGKISDLGYECIVNIDSEDSAKPGTAFIWKTTVPISNVENILKCRIQVAFLNNYAFLNIYAPSGSGKRYERSIFYAVDLYRLFHLYKGYSWVMGGDYNAVLSHLDIENGTGFDQKKCPQLADIVNIMGG